LKKQHKNLIKIIVILIIAAVSSPLVYINTLASNLPTTQWVKIYDGGHNDMSFAITTDSSSNVIVTGTSKINNKDIACTIKYNKDGNELFKIYSNTTTETKGLGVVTDSYNNIIVAGCVINSFGDHDYYIAKYDQNGNEIWVNTYDSNGEDFANDITIDSNDNIIATGEASEDFYTIKFSSSGSQIWNKTYDSSNIDEARSLVVDSFGNIIVTGNVNNGGSRDWFTIKYDSNGNIIWSKTFSNNEINSANSVKTDSQDNIIIVGTVYINSNSNLYVIKYDSTGNILWQNYYDMSVVESGSDVAINSRDEIIASGSYTATFEKSNCQLVKYDKDGNFIWIETFDRSNDNDYCSGLYLDGLNKMIISGSSRNNNQYDYVTIKYGEDPIANFSYLPTSPTTLDTIQFIDESIDPAGIIVDWQWDFDDGSTSNEQNPNHQFSDDGIYSVSLTITDDDGAQDTVTKDVEVLNIPPSSDFSYQLVDSFLKIVQFNDTSSDSDGNVVTWLWDFGDGNISNVQNPLYQYKNNGTYLVTLTVTDDDGDSDITSQLILVAPIPSKVTGLTVNDAKDGKLDLSWNANNDVAPVDYYKIYRDGAVIVTLSNTQYQDFNLNIGQVYTYRVSAVNIFGMEGEKSNSVSGISKATGSNGGKKTGGVGNTNYIKNKHPIADASAGEPYIGLVGEEILFNGSLSYDPDGDIISYHWNFGDGNDADGPIVVHKYSEIGEYNVVLTVKDNKLVKANTQTKAIIKESNTPPTSPKITGAIEGTRNQVYNFTFNSSDIDNDIIFYIVMWGDKSSDISVFVNPGSLVILNHSWSQAGIYNIQANASDNQSYSNNSEFIIYIDVILIIDNGIAIGYIIDYDSDGTYDKFYSFSSEEEYDIKKLKGNNYLIDIEGDGKFDYLFNLEKRSLEDNSNIKTKQENIFSIWIIFWLLIILFIILLFILFIPEKGERSSKDGKLPTHGFLLFLAFLPELIKQKNPDYDPISKMTVDEIEDFVDDLPYIEPEISFGFDDYYQKPDYEGEFDIYSDLSFFFFFIILFLFSGVLF
jgi:uncharacterized delta-60 repeat protein